LTAIGGQKIRLLCKHGGRGHCSPRLIAHPSHEERDESEAVISLYLFYITFACMSMPLSFHVPVVWVENGSLFR
jgi:hypothetical protein